MDVCSFENLVHLLDGKLSPSVRLRVLGHLDRCEICRDTMYHIARDREESASVSSKRVHKTAPGKPHSSETTPVEFQESTTESLASARPPATGTLG